MLTEFAGSQLRSTSRLPRNIIRSVRDELKPELCGLFPKSVLSALYGFFGAAVKDTFVVGFPSAEQMVNNPSELVSRGGDGLGFAEFPSDAPKELTEIIFCMMQRVGRHA